MNLKKAISVILCLALTFACCNFVYAANPVVKVTVNVAKGETKDISAYLKSGTGTISWTNSKPAVATVKDKTIRGISVGTTLLKGTSSIATYQITVKVLNDYSAPETVSTISTSTNTGEVKNSKGEVISYNDRYITMGVNDTIDISSFLNYNLSYDSYSWGITNEKCLSFKKGKITSKAEGIVKISARPRSSQESNTIYRFFITIDSNALAKNITVGKERLTPLVNFISGDPANYVYNVVSVGNGYISIKDDKYIESSSSTGSCILTAESTTGGNNYCFIVKVR